MTFITNKGILTIFCLGVTSITYSQKLDTIIYSNDSTLFFSGTIASTKKIGVWVEYDARTKMALKERTYIDGICVKEKRLTPGAEDTLITYLMSGDRKGFVEFEYRDDRVYVKRYYYHGNGFDSLFNALGIECPGERIETYMILKEVYVWSDIWNNLVIVRQHMGNSNEPFILSYYRKGQFLFSQDREGTFVEGNKSAYLKFKRKHRKDSTIPYRRIGRVSE